MKILVDHGASHNLGDIAMLESLVLKLCKLFPEEHIYVIDRPNLRTNLWHFSSKIHKQTSYGLHLPLLDNSFTLRFIPEMISNRFRKLISNVLLSNLGKTMFSKDLRLKKNISLSTDINNLSAFCKQFDALVICGGGNLSDHFHSIFFLKCCLIYSFLEQNKPVVLTGQQIGPFTSRNTKQNLIKFLSKVDFIGIRDPGDSLLFCKNNLPSNYVLMGDDSFGLPRIDELSISNTLLKYGLKPGKFIALNVRSAFYAKEINSNLKNIAQLVKALNKKTNLAILIVPIAFNNDDNDLTTAKKITSLTKDSQIIILDDQVLTPQLVKGIIGKAFGAIGVSYHFCTFALIEGTPAICLYDGSYYTQKAKSIGLFWGDQRLLLALDKINFNSATKQIVDVFNDQYLRDRLKLRSAQANLNWHSNFEIFKKILTGS